MCDGDVPTIWSAPADGPVPFDLMILRDLRLLDSLGVYEGTKLVYTRLDMVEVRERVRDNAVADGTGRVW